MIMLSVSLTASPPGPSPSPTGHPGGLPCLDSYLTRDAVARVSRTTHPLGSSHRRRNRSLILK